MTPIEEVLRATLRDHASDLVPSPWSIDAAVGGGGRLRRRRVSVVMSSLVVAVLAVAAAAAGVSLPVPDGRGQPAAGVARIVLPGGGYPGLTMDSDNIYVWQISNGPEAPFVAVVDRSTNRVVRREPLPGNPKRYVSGPGDSLWFSTNADSAGTTEVLVQLDRERLAVRRTVRLPEAAIVDSLAVSGNALWVGSGLSLFELDGTTGRLLRRLDLGGLVTDVVVDPRSNLVYANVIGGPGPEGLVQLDGRTGTVIARRTIQNVSSTPVPAGDGVWVTTLDSPVGRPSVRHLDRHGLVDRDPGQAGSSGRSAYVVGGTGRYLFLASVPPQSRLTCVDPDSGRVLGTASLATPQLADAEAVYGQTSGALQRVDTAAVCRR